MSQSRNEHPKRSVHLERCGTETWRQRKLSLVLLSVVAVIGACSSRVSLEEEREELELAGIDKELQTVPEHFFNQLLAEDLNQPTAMAFLPDGRVLVAEKAGVLRIGNPQAAPMVSSVYLQLADVEFASERGLLDVVVDPEFATTRAIYVYYSRVSTGKFRVARFTHVENSGGLTSRANLTSETLIWTDTDNVSSCCHYGGSLSVGPDNKLYLAIGDKFVGTNAPDLTKAAGKLLRMNKDGSTPNGADGFPPNPYVNGPNYDKIWAYGLRNPFRASWDMGPGAGAGRLLIGEVGGNESKSWEDLHLATAQGSFAGSNFGWPDCEGVPPFTDFPTCNAAGHRQPIFAYKHGTLSYDAAIMSGFVYRGARFPATYRGVFFYGDYARRVIRYLTFDYAGDPSGATPSGDFAFETKAGPVVTLKQGVDGALYYLTFQKVGAGTLRRISYDGTNNPPLIQAEAANPAAGVAPLSVNFRADVSDIDLAPLTYTWHFGDGTSVGGILDPGQGVAGAAHTYTSNGRYRAYLAVSDGAITMSSPEVVVQVGVPPRAVIDTPLDGSHFEGQDTVSFRGHADDPDETRPEQVEYRWQVQLGHDTHVHPVIAPTGALGPAGASFAVVDAAHDFLGNTGFRIDLTVTDSDGLQGVDFVETWPSKVPVTLRTSPVDIVLALDDFPTATPRNFDTLRGWRHKLSAPDSSCVDGVQYSFAAWDQLGARIQTVAIDGPAVFTANYQTVGSCAAALPTHGLVYQVQGDIGLETSGSTVTRWHDMIGANELEVVSGNPQRVAGGLNGHDTVLLDGVDDILGVANSTGLPSGNADRSVFMVARYVTDGYGGFSWGSVACNGMFGLAVSKETSRIGNLVVQGWCGANDFEAPVVGTGAGWLTQSAVLGSGVVRHFKDGEQIASFAHDYATAIGKLRLGAEHNDKKKLGMEVAEVLIYDRAVTELERGQIEAYFEQRYFGGIQANVAPLAADDTASVSEPGGTIVLNVLANDGDPDGSIDPSSVTILTYPSQGAVTLDLETGVITYVHSGTTAGTDSFTYWVSDEAGAPSNAATVTLTVLSGAPQGGGANVPITSGLVYHIHGDVGIDASVGVVTRWDNLVGDNDLVLIAGNPRRVSASLNGHAGVLFDGVDDILGASTMTGFPTANADRSVFMVARYTSDGYGGFSWGTVACNGMFGLSVSKETNGLGNLVVQGWCGANDFEVPVVGTGTGWLRQAAVFGSGSVRHYKDNALMGTFAHSYATGLGKVRLGAEHNDKKKVGMEVAEVLVYNRAVSDSERAEIDAYLNARYFGNPPPVNVAPTAVADSAVVTTGGLTVIEVLANDGDSDGVLDPNSVTLQTAPIGGTVSVNPATGAITYTHTAPTAGTDSFTYSVRDVAGAQSNTATVTVTISAAGGSSDSLPVVDGLVYFVQGDVGLQTSGSTVVRWNDQAGHNDLTVLSGNPQVALAALKGHDTVVFDGVDDIMGVSATSGLPAGNSDRSVFGVVRYTTDGYGGFSWGTVACNGMFGLAVSKEANKVGNLVVQGWCGDNDFEAPVVATGAGWFTQIAILSGGSVLHFKDATGIASFNHTYATGLGKMRLGVEHSDKKKVGMEVAEILVYSRALSAQERQQVQSYLSQRYF